MEQIVYNGYGEPIGTEYIRDCLEEEIAYCEEMDRRAEDPMYAASVENQMWYNAACAAFKERGIKVPEDVIAALSREMRRKKREVEEQEALREAEPVVNLFNKLIPNCGAEAIYYPETVDEIGYTEIHFKKHPTKCEIALVIQEGYKMGLYVEDFVF